MFTRRYCSISILSVFFLLPLFAKTQTAQQWMQHGDKSFEEKDYYGAAFYYEKAVSKDSNFLTAYYKYATALRLNNDYKKAEKAYHYVWQNNESKEFSDALLYKAIMEKQNEKYSDALEHFERFLKTEKDRSSWGYKKAKQEVISCKWAIDHKNENNDTVNVKHLGNSINTFDAEFSPYLLSDSTLLFSTLKYDQKETKIADKEGDLGIFNATKKDEFWEVDSVPLYIESLSENIGIANPTISPDGKRLYFTHCDGENCHIYVSQRMDTAWGSPQNPGEAININGYTSTQPYITTIDGAEYLFFSSDRPKTKGGFDIWYSVIKKGGKKYGRARNPGKKINSPDHELTPFYDTEEQKLFFSSSWYNGFGGYDIFSSTGTPKSLNQPINIGKPYNSAANDLYYSYRDDLKLGALISNRKGGFALKGETCCNDIYSITFENTKLDTLPPDTPSIDTPLVALNTPPPSTSDIPPEQNLTRQLIAMDVLPLSVYFENDQPKPQSNSSYQLLYNNYLSNIHEYRDRNAIDMFGLFFNNDLEKGFNDLNILADSLLVYLKKEYKITLGIRGYTSSLASEDYNRALSQRRINSVQRFLSQTNHGELVKYFENGKLGLLPYVVGEKLSDGVVNDNREDVLSSVYSIDACKARRVEIGWINQRKSTVKTPVLQLEQVVFDIKINGNSGALSLPVFNPGDSELIIEAQEVNEKDYSIFYNELKLAPGQKSNLNISVKFNTENKRIIPLSINSNASGNGLPIWLKKLN